MKSSELVSSYFTSNDNQPLFAENFVHIEETFGKKTSTDVKCSKRENLNEKKFASKTEKLERNKKIIKVKEEIDEMPKQISSFTA